MSSFETSENTSNYGGYFKGFHSLMPFRVRDILLVSSLYDSFILGQDGQLNELILSEFLDLNLFTVPGITRVSSGLKALETIREQRKYDLIITSTRLPDMSVKHFADKVKDVRPNLPITLLAFDLRELNDHLKEVYSTNIERSFLWQGDIQILLAIVKYIEDKLNVEHDTKGVGVQSIILIEDNVRYYSSFLPVIYSEVLKQSQSLLREGINLAHKILRMRARSKILLCSTYEEAVFYFKRYQENVLGIISDIEFPRESKHDAEAGFRFAKMVKNSYPDVPIILQSSKTQNRRLAKKLQAAFLLKNSPTLLDELRHFMINNFGFGDFVFRLEDGTAVGNASDLRSLGEVLLTIPEESVKYHAERNHFSKWLKARTEFELADKLRPQKVSDFESIEEVRQYLISALREFRTTRIRGVIEDFDRDSFDFMSHFTRVGSGSLGGKARGLAFVRAMLDNYGIQQKYKNISIFVPPSLTIGTDIFDQFMEENSLRKFALRTNDDRKIFQRFTETPFPKAGRVALESYLRLIKYPLAVRSSSLLEDSQYQPFSGVYHTYMLPNNHPDLSVRLEQLLQSIKMVYASTYSRSAKGYIKATPYRLEEEKMAVIIQQLIGLKHHNRFYPNFSGVARSYNYYPVHPMTVHDGIAIVALGFGKTVVEGGNAYRFCPRFPKRNIQSSNIKGMLDFSQKAFYALDLDEHTLPAPLSEEDLSLYDLDIAYNDETLQPIGSVYSPDNDRVYERLLRSGIRFINFAPILNHNYFPLADIINLLLELGRWGIGAPVEIEFAVNLNSKDKSAEFAFLQMRPLVVRQEMEELTIGQVNSEELICKSSQVLGNGVINNIYDIVYIDPQSFDRSKTRKMAAEINHYNKKLSSQGRPYLLIGIGRMGSADPWLGIPVAWDKISGVKVIVETGFQDITVTPSQGSHFFQNLSTFMIGYFTINENNDIDFIDWKWLQNQIPSGTKKYVKHIRCDEPFIIKMIGKDNKGVIFKPASSTS